MDATRLNFTLGYLLVLLGFLFSDMLLAGVLPEERADALYHYYDGGGVDISGPSILVRKSIKDKVSVSANYYVDNVSSASIDVVTTASAYTEERVEKSVGIDYLHEKTLMSFNYTASDENDFSARSAHINVAQDFFGDLTTLSLGYSQGWDEVGKRGEADFSEENDRRHFRLGLSQIMTKNSLLAISFETITDQGYLNNPYRSVRYRDETVPAGYSYESELYPATRTSDAFALRGMYYLAYRAALKFELKAFADTWGIKANTAEIAYTHTLGDHWIFDVKLRHYQQDKADFFNDLYEAPMEDNLRARDKELSGFSSNTFGFGASYQKEFVDQSYFDKYSVNFYFDRIQFDYEDFRNLTVDAEVGLEPLYQFDANVFRIFVSVFY